MENPDLTNELWNRRCGYWLFPMSLDLPPNLPAGRASPIGLTLENRGVAPPYHSCDLRVRLANSGSSWEGMLGRTDRSWLPDTPIIVRNQLDLPADLKPGRYTVNFGHFEGSRPVEFAMRASLRQVDGFYRVGEIEVEGRQ